MPSTSSATKDKIIRWLAAASSQEFLDWILGHVGHRMDVSKEHEFLIKEPIDHATHQNLTILPKFSRSVRGLQEALTGDVAHPSTHGRSFPRHRCSLVALVRHRRRTQRSLVGLADPMSRPNRPRIGSPLAVRTAI